MKLFKAMPDDATTFLRKDAKLALCDYRVLEYSASELRARGDAFLLVLRLHLSDEYELKGFLLKEWRDLLRVPSYDEEEIEIFVGSLRSEIKSNNSGRAFLEKIDGLGVGPIRMFASGSCSTDDLDQIVPLFFEGRVLSRGSWQDDFDHIQ
jgi:hypothetical protein